VSAFYNENDPFAAAWLGSLITGGHIAHGRVDSRSIADLEPADIGSGQAHFFAGIGGWSHALRLAGVADEFPVWTGSCPCQPFSSAGRGAGFSDERHLWPAWFRLIRECRPAIIFGEQVASPAGLGWFDAVSADLEGEGYAVGAADLCAAGVGAPHIRQRLYFVAYATDGRRERRRAGEASRGAQQPERLRAAGLVGDSDDAGPQGWDQRGDGAGERSSGSPGVAGSFWSRAEWLPCRDGKARLVESSIFPLATGVRNRVGTLRGAGNSIVPQVAAEFVIASLEAMRGERKWKK